MKLFIDDIRTPPDDSWKVAKNSNEAKKFIEDYGIPDCISFDHDLGEDDTSMIFVNWLIDQILDKNVVFSKFKFFVHSDNPVGSKNIEETIKNFWKFYFNENYPNKVIKIKNGEQF